MRTGRHQVEEEEEAEADQRHHVEGEPLANEGGAGEGDDGQEDEALEVHGDGDRERR